VEKKLDRGIAGLIAREGHVREEKREGTTGRFREGVHEQPEWLVGR